MRRLAGIACVALVWAGAAAGQAGAAYFQSARLTVPGATANDSLGYAVALAGDTLAVGAPVEGSENRGAVYVFERSGTSWALKAKLTASDSAAGQQLGYSVAIAGDTIVAGAPAPDTAAVGAVYVFAKPPGGWTDGGQTAKLTAPVDDLLGTSVAIAEDTIYTGAPRWEPATQSGSFNSGGIFVFVKPAGAWANDTAQDAILAVPEPYLTDTAYNGELGRALAVDGGTVVGGAPGSYVAANHSAGAGFVFRRPANGWTSVASPIAPEARLRADDLGDHVASSVAIAGDAIVLGEPLDDTGATDRGVAHVFVRGGATWTNMDTSARLAPSDAGQLFFGQAVAMSADRIVVGAPLYKVGSEVRGLAYVYNRPATGWESVPASARLAAPDADGAVALGWATAVAGDTVVAGAIGFAQSVGAAYVFVDDSVPPDTLITSGAEALGTDTTPTFEFTASESEVTFACRIDDGAFVACSSPFTPPPLADGGHTFYVQATDRVGNVDATPAERAFTVDTTAPRTTIGDRPAALTADSTPTLSMTADDGAATFACSVDLGPFTACSSPFTPGPLADGPHTVVVRATDAVGNVEGAPPSASFTVDATAPETTIGAGPPARATNPSPTFAFTASEPGASFVCRVDAGAYSPCASPVTLARLKPGAHTFAVHAIDAAGNVDATDATRAFVVLPPIVAAGAVLRNALVGRVTHLLGLRIVDLVGGESILVKCKGRGCPLKRRTAKSRAGRATLNLDRLVRGGRLRPGAVVTVEISRADTVAKVIQFRARRTANLKVTRRCRAPGERALRACSAFA